MGGYEELIAGIKAVVRRNGRREITGDALQQVLVGMVSGAFGGELKTGLLFAVVFPVFLIAAALACKRALRHQKDA